MVLAWPSLRGVGLRGALWSKVLQAAICRPPCPHHGFLPPKPPKPRHVGPSALVHSGRSHQRSGTCPPLAPHRLLLQGLSPSSGATAHVESLWQLQELPKRLVTLLILLINVY